MLLNMTKHFWKRSVSSKTWQLPTNYFSARFTLHNKNISAITGKVFVTNRNNV